MRKAGVLLPIASLPSDTGIGEFGKYAFKFIDHLEKMHMKIWQILPINPLGFGNSPYQPYSSCAGEPLYIDLYQLKEIGLIDSEIKDYREQKEVIAYDKVRSYKEPYFEEAFRNFKQDESYEVFIKQPWVYLYAVFMSLKKTNGLKCWNEWPIAHKEWVNNQSKVLDIDRTQIEYEMFLQYIFYLQWNNLKKYANKKGIEIMGDIPIYVGIDSVDVWSNQESFLLDKEGRPICVAGVPPDYFSPLGQRWGNPIYDWEHIKKEKFKFWMDRLENNMKMFDILRIDHFRAFDTYWKIPGSNETAVEGEWVEAPGYELFDKVFETWPKINIVVEDLGDLREEVYELRDYYDFKGMHIIQFKMDERYQREDEKENIIVYTGTHDNQTIKGWYNSQGLKKQRSLKKYFMKQGYTYREIAHKFVAYTLDSPAEMAILPLQDLLGVGDEARLNTPGTVGSPNWEWKLRDFSKLTKYTPLIQSMVDKSKRMF